MANKFSSRRTSVKHPTSSQGTKRKRKQSTILFPSYFSSYNTKDKNSEHKSSLFSNRDESKSDIDELYYRIWNMDKNSFNLHFNKQNENKDTFKPGKRREQPLYSQWSKWTRCSKKCKQTRRRRCRRPELCGTALIKVGNNCRFYR